ncbi:MAG: glycosyltransferase [Solirubrobacterales bacterium]|nr:glycosyltransferase [Solirubrobacterales bacterium]HRV59214.1 glycosyltransferase [Solirubrobacterales bacterium]
MVPHLIAAEWLPFQGLDPFFQALFMITFLIVVAMFFWTIVLFFRGVRSTREMVHRDEVNPELFEWVFLVPALNEEVTIADSVSRLEALEIRRKRIVVINDGSDDRTAEILAERTDPDLYVVERKPPEARQGKAAALNFAFHEVTSRFKFNPETTIFCVVDADGRIAPDSLPFVAQHFMESEVGGVQTLVRIYNRHQVLTWFQDLEFSIYGHLFQAGRNKWGTAGMGGNGQYNRMDALISIDDRDPGPGEEAIVEGDPEPDVETDRVSRGPWRDRLTEDQDLGLRLLVAGWRCHHDNRATVEQQGLPGLRRLFRQRTRWSQGNLQAMGLIDDMVTSKLYFPARFEQVVYLMMPVWQMIVGASLIASIYLFFFEGISFFANASDWWWLYFLYLLGFGGTVLGSIAAKIEDRNILLGIIKGLLTGQIYAFYTWLLWPVLFRSSIRQFTSRDTWAKTSREQIHPAADS